MSRIFGGIMMALAWTALVAAQGDGFPREGEGEGRAKKDALEGKAPPRLAVESWMNTEGKALDLASLRGKVVVLDFWGTW